MKKENLSVLDSFELVSQWDGLDEETIAEIQKELAELGVGANNLDTKRIITPSGSSKAFTVETDNPDDPDAEKVIEAVVLFNHKMNMYWDTAFGETAEAKAPTCSSMDGETGCVYETGETRKCATCPYNQFVETSEGFTRKACKNTRRLYLVMSGKPYIYVLTVPPTSVRSVTEALKTAVTRCRLPLSRIVMRFTLTSAVSNGGKSYNKIVAEPVGILGGEVVEKIAEMKASVKESYTLIAASSADLLPSGSTPALSDWSELRSDGNSKTCEARPNGNTEFREVKAADESDLPF